PGRRGPPAGDRRRRQPRLDGRLDDGEVAVRAQPAEEGAEVREGLVARGHPVRAQTRASATAPGSACTQRILRLAVAAPKTPATTTQTRKKISIDRPALPRLRPQRRPAARKPL